MDKEKYLRYEFPSEKKEFSPWNQMTFFDCKVNSIEVKEYQAGKKVCIEIEAPKLRKKYYLFAWSDMGIADTILQSGLRAGDYISCYTELSYYQNKDGRHCEAYRIVPNYAYIEGIPEQKIYFKLMRIRREEVKKQDTTSKYLSKNDILKKMLG